MSPRLNLAAPRLLIVRWLAAAALAAAGGCNGWADELFCDGACGLSDTEWARMSALANLGPPPAEPSNAVVNRPEAQRLGQAFYFDTRFSGTATQVDALGRPAAVARAPKGQPVNISCASCHDLGRYGVDVASNPGNVSAGAGWTDVNALSTVNCAYGRLFFWNGRVDSVWALAVAVAESATTMNGNRLHTAWVIADNYRADYEALFGPLPIPAGITQCQAASLSRFPLNGRPGVKGCQPDDPREPFGDAYDCMAPDDQTAIDAVLVNWAKALEAFQYALISIDSPFDRFINEGPRSSAIDESARRGAQLFAGKASCIDCHGTPLLGDGAFHNVGVAQVGPEVPTVADCVAGMASCDCVAGTKCLPWGEYDGQDRLNGNRFRRTPKQDPTEQMKGAWRTPSLRNVAMTAPYMHDGRYATLEEVIAHYNRGGDPDAVGQRDVRIKPLRLTDGEQADLAAFLRTLTGPPVDPSLATAPALPPTVVCP